MEKAALSRTQFRCLGQWGQVLKCLLLVLASFLVTDLAWANRTITGVSVNGAASVTVVSGATVSLTVNVTTNSTGSSNWRGTDWAVATSAPAASAYSCYNNPNHDSAGSYSETFNITAPVSPGTYNVYVIAYSDNGCSSSASTTYTLVGSIIVVPRSCVSARTGVWSAATTWNCGSGTGNGPPNSTDNVTINNHIITLDASPTVASLTNNGGTLQRTATTSRTLTVSGDFTNSGSVTNTASSGTLTISVGGNLANNGTGISANTLTVSGNTTNNAPLTVGTAMAVGGDLTVNGGNFNVASLTFQKTGAQSAVFTGPNSIVGNLTINGGSAVSSTEWSTLQITGNFTNNGSFSLPNTTVKFNGGAVQSIGGGADATLGFLVVDGAGVSMARNMTVSKLTLTKGDVTTGTYSLNVTGGYCPSSVEGGSASSHVVGNLRLKFPDYATTCIYPVGDGTIYAPITVEIPWFSNVAGMKDKTLTGKTIAGQHPQIATSGINQVMDVNRYWVLGVTGDTLPGALPTGGAYNPTFQFAASDILGGAQVSNFAVSRYTSSAWTSPVIPLSSYTATTVRVVGMSAFGDYVTGQAGYASPGQCAKPAFVPDGVTCYCEDFTGDAATRTSKIFDAQWTVSSSGGRSYDPNFTTTSPRRLRLTDAQTNEATSATLGAIFPAAGNYISVEFRQYTYGGNGADGMAVVLSDYKVTPKPGAFGGSLGYAQKGQSPISDCTISGGCAGFSGGWIGVGFDEYGGYSSNGEGRSGGPGARKNAIAVRGSYAGDYKSGYPYLAGTAADTLTNGSLGYNYQVIIDAREYKPNNKTAKIAVNRDTCTTDFCGANYSALVTSFDVYKPSGVTPATAQADVPENWQISFTGSTGALYNIHEISGLRICAQKIIPPTGANASGFNAVDEVLVGTPAQNDIIVQSSARIYTKLVGTDFKLNIAALNAAPVAVNKNYVGVGKKTVKVELLDNSSAAEQAKSCKDKSKSIASQDLEFSSTDAGFKKTTSAFNIPNAYTNVIVRMSDGTTTGCSTDNFSIRPWSFSSLSAKQGSTNLDSADGDLHMPAPDRTPIFVAGSSFDLTANAVNGANQPLASYTGKPTINTANVQDWVNWAANKTYSLTLSCDFPNPAAGGVVTGNCRYGDVGYFWLGADALVDTTFTAVDNSSSRSDCVADSSSNALITNPNDLNYGRYGCNIGSGAQSWWGRFVPSHFELQGQSLTNRADLPACSSSFAYMGEPMALAFKMTAKNADDGVTGNYQEVAYSRKGTPASPVPLSPVQKVNWAKLSADTWLSLAPDNTPAYKTLNLWALNAPPDPPSPAAPSVKTTFPSGRIAASTPAGSYGVECSENNNLKTASATPWCGGSADFKANVILTRLSAGLDGPFNDFYMGIAPIDEDGVALKSSLMDMDANQDGAKERRAVGSATSVRFGLLRLTTTYGSEQLPLNVPIEARYWNGAGFILNTDDACTIPALAAANVAWTPEATALNPSISYSSTQPGKGRIVLPTPDKTKRSAFRVCLDISSDDTCKRSSGGTEAPFGYLTGPWDGSTVYDRDPSARAVFGLSRGAYLYYRELY